MKLSEHFTLEEMTFSSTAIRKGLDNTPGQLEINNLKFLCENTLERIRVALNKPIKVTSGFRSKRVNREVGGTIKPISQHTKGQAADIQVDGMTTEELFQWFLKSGIIYDQAIQEYDSWLHVSVKAEGNRGEALRYTRVDGVTAKIKVN